MERNKLEHYRRVLLEERENMLNLQRSIEEGPDGQSGLHESFKESTMELSSYDNHPADHGDITFERAKDIGLMDHFSGILSMITDALDKIDAGTYGTCDQCGSEIPEERLETFPYSTMCVQCKRFHEDAEQPRERPIEEDFLNPPFARTFTDGEDNVAFDGEDAWQKVARYGTSNAPVDEPNAVRWDDTFYDADEDEGLVDWGDAIIDDGFLDEYADDEHTGQITRRERQEYRRKD